MGKSADLKPETYVRQARKEITLWEAGKRGYLARLSDVVLNPAAKLTARIVPKTVQKAASQMIEKSLRSIAQAGEFSVDAAAIIRERDKRLGRKRAVGARLKVCDAMATRFWKSHCGYAAAEGAATGGGWIRRICGGHSPDSFDCRPRDPSDRTLLRLQDDGNGRDRLCHARLADGIVGRAGGETGDPAVAENAGEGAAAGFRKTAIASAWRKSLSQRSLPGDHRRVRKIPGHRVVAGKSPSTVANHRRGDRSFPQCHVCQRYWPRGVYVLPSAVSSGCGGLERGGIKEPLESSVRDSRRCKGHAQFDSRSVEAGVERPE